MLLAWLWDASPILFEIFGRDLRWYGVLFAVAFFAGRALLRYIYGQEKLAKEPVDSIFLHVFVGVVIGARLGHVLFYDPAYYFSDPIKILYIHEGGLASHGAAIGVLLALWRYAWRYKVNYLWLLDRCIIVITLAGMFIRLGNFMNSEIYGKPTSSPSGVVFLHGAHILLKRQLKADDITFQRLSTLPSAPDSLFKPHYVPLQITLHYEHTQIDTLHLKMKVERTLPWPMFLAGDHLEYIPATQRIHTNTRNTNVSFHAYGKPRHPTQLYEAGWCLVMFLFLWYWWLKKRPPNGQLFAAFLILLWSGRFLIEFYKEPQEQFEPLWGIHMGQWLSIPFILIGVGVWLYTIKYPAKRGATRSG